MLSSLKNMVSNMILKKIYGIYRRNLYCCQKSTNTKITKIIWVKHSHWLNSYLLSKCHSHLSLSEQPQIIKQIFCPFRWRSMLKVISEENNITGKGNSRSSKSTTSITTFSWKELHCFHFLFLLSPLTVRLPAAVKAAQKELREEGTG